MREDKDKIRNAEEEKFRFVSTSGIRCDKRSRAASERERHSHTRAANGLRIGWRLAYTGFHMHCGEVIVKVAEIDIKCVSMLRSLYIIIICIHIFFGIFVFLEISSCSCCCRAVYDFILWRSVSSFMCARSHLIQRCPKQIHSDSFVSSSFFTFSSLALWFWKGKSEVERKVRKEKVLFSIFYYCLFLDLCMESSMSLVSRPLATIRRKHCNSVDDSRNRQRCRLVYYSDNFERFQFHVN